MGANLCQRLTGGGGKMLRACAVLAVDAQQTKPRNFLLNKTIKDSPSEEKSFDFVRSDG